MPHPSDLAQRFCAFHNDSLEIPDFLRVDADEQRRRDAAAKGKRLRWTRDMNFKGGPKELDPGTVKLLEERKAAERAAAAKKKADQKEARIIKARQKATPGAMPITEGVDDVKKIATKASRKARKQTQTSRRAQAATKADRAKKAGKTKNIAKHRANENARTAATGKVGRKDEVIAMMQRPEGVTVAQIEETTKMKPHSARALISGIAKDHKVETSKAAGEKTVYKIAKKA